MKYCRVSYAYCIREYQKLTNDIARRAKQNNKIASNNARNYIYKYITSGVLFGFSEKSLGGSISFDIFGGLNELLIHMRRMCFSDLKQMA